MSRSRASCAPRPASGIGVPKRRAVRATVSSSCAREATGSLCALAQAPMRLLPGARGEVARRCRPAGAGTTAPSMRTCRCSASQCITTAARGLRGQLAPLARVVVGVEHEVAGLRHDAPCTARRAPRAGRAGRPWPAPWRWGWAGGRRAWPPPASALTRLKRFGRQRFGQVFGGSGHAAPMLEPCAAAVARRATRPLRCPRNTDRKEDSPHRPSLHDRERDAGRAAPAA